MAEVLYYRIEFTGNNPYGDFVAGDIVELYYDDSSVPPFYPGQGTSGVVVYHNGVVINSGADIVLQNVNYKTEQWFGPTVCYTTSLVLFNRKQEFPYFYYVASPNNPACANNGDVCDLVFSGTPQITAASFEESDGSISVTATSSHGPIEYRLQTNFNYGDGNGQSSGTFTGLAAGQYRIWARDSFNCSANIFVTIPEKDIAYNPIYRLEYDDPVGGVTRVDVTKRNYAGDLTEVKGANIGFERALKGEASTDKFETILATKATLHLTSETNFAFSGLYTNNPDEFRLQYYKLSDASQTSAISLPGLSSWDTGDTSSDKPNWTTGAAPSVTLTGASIFSPRVSEILYTDYAFLAGRAYTINITFTRATLFAGTNPRTARIQITDVSGNVAFEQAKAADEGSNTISITFTANAQCERIAFSYSTGSNVTITVNSVSGTIDGFALTGIYKVLPQQYSEEYKAAPYYVSIVATDGLPSLKDYVFLKDDGQRFFESIKAIKLIAYILQKTGLRLNIRVAINLYATGMDDDDDDDPLDQAFVDCDTYYINETEPTLDYVLRQILEPFGASIVQEFGIWHIVRVEEKRGEYDYREFDADGEYVANDSYDPILDVAPVGSEGFHFSYRDHHLTLMPGYGKIRVFYRLGLRENILENGDFRLTSVYDSTLNEYGFTVDKRGFELVNAGYPISSSWEPADVVVTPRLFGAPIVTGDRSNIAWRIESGFEIESAADRAYIQSDTYNIKMGSANQLKISVRFKVPEPRTFGLSAITIPIPYQKVRMRVKYGMFYMQGDGSWSTNENFITIYVTEYGKYVDYSFTASQPDGGAASGYDFDIRLYHSYIFDAEVKTTDGGNWTTLKGVETYDGTDQVLPEGARIEVSNPGAAQSVYYFELEENTEDELIPNIVRPDDYHAVNNPRQWVQKKRVVKTIFTNFRATFWVDYIRVEFLTNGSAPTDTILREIAAEDRNPATLDLEVTHGSYQSLITTIPQWDFGVGKFSTTTSATLSLITTNVLSAEILFAGYFRDRTGAGFTTWTRDGVAEESSLHLILLQQYAAQYKRSWRRLTGSFYSQSRYFNFLNVLRIVNDSNRLYLPISPTIDDVNNRVRGEFLELIDSQSSAGSDGSGNSPFTSGFSAGFGKGYK